MGQGDGSPRELLRWEAALGRPGCEGDAGATLGSDGSQPCANPFLTGGS